VNFIDGESYYGKGEAVEFHHRVVKPEIIQRFHGSCVSSQEFILKVINVTYYYNLFMQLDSQLYTKKNH
jgi:hypothetical protein